MSNAAATPTTQALLEDMRQQLTALDSREQELERLIADAWGTPDQNALESELVTLPTRRRAAEIVLARLEQQRIEEERAAILDDVRNAVIELLASEAERDKAMKQIEKAQAQLKRAEQAQQDAIRKYHNRAGHIRHLQERLKQTGLSPDDAERLTREITTSARKQRR